ncbi:MAG TPA: response regulator transcription factor [Sphingomonas sp.]|nr:response regulator transcription factor [Sphingomonas sp.]
MEREADIEAAVAELTEARANLLDLRTIILVHQPDRTIVRRALRSGIDAVLSKDISGEVLQRSLDLVMLGQKLFPAAVFGEAEAGAGQPIAAGLPTTQAVPPALKVSSTPAATSMPVSMALGGEIPLSEREDQILRCLVAGLANKLIARDLGITEGTVKVHIKALLRKIRAGNRTQAAIWAMSRGITLENGTVPPAPGSANRPRPALQSLGGPN